MRQERQGILRQFRGAQGAAKCLAAVVLVWCFTGFFPGVGRPAVGDGSPRAFVRRAALRTTLKAAGLVESSVCTVIRCEVENISTSSSSKNRATTILSLAPEGSMVKKGNTLCRLDDSEYQEQLRLQQISAAQARSDKRRAELDLEIAHAALREYEEGSRRVRRREFEARIALARAEVARLTDRCEWTRRMLNKGYLARAQAATETSLLRRTEFELSQVETAFQTFEEFEVPKTRKVMEGRIEETRATLAYEDLRSRRQQERLAHLQRQVALCTITAPHDGLLVYAHKPKRDLRIEEGIGVYQKQAIMFLPDLSRLEVQALIHETVVDQARPGMRARFRLEGSARWLEGTLTGIDMLPVADHGKRSSGEVKYFVGRIQPDELFEILRPGMTAEVEIETGRSLSTLVVPVGAARREDGRDVCYVVHHGAMERRPVSVGRTDPSWLEVTAGVVEGEEVALAGANRAPLPGKNLRP